MAGQETSGREITDYLYLDKQFTESLHLYAFNTYYYLL